MAEAKKRVAAHTICEIIDIEPLSYKVPEKADKGKAMATVPQKMKGSLPPGPLEKRMNDVFSTRASSEGLDAGGDLARDAGARRRFMPAWKLARETNLGTVVKRSN